MKRDNKYSVYTPENIAKNIGEKVLKEYFSGDFSVEKIENLRVCDLSCGSGNLILPILQLLLSYSKKIYGEYRFNEKWITGYDINNEAVKLTKVRATEILKKYSLNGELNIICDDGLMVEGQKFNIVVGNPPYLGEKNNKALFQKIKSSDFGMKYYEAKMDYFYFFIEKGVEILEQNGFMYYLTTNYWLKADSGKKLRECLSKNGKYLHMEIYDFSLFSEAMGQHNIIFSWQKGETKDRVIKINLQDESFEMLNSEIYDENNKIILADSESREYNKRIKAKSNFKLGDLVNINQGIVTGFDKAFIFNEFQEEFKEYLKPFYKNKDVGLYKNSENKFWILYLDNKVELNFKLENYLLNFYEKLSKRREVIKGHIKWWQLQWPRERELFSKEKILVRQRCKTNQFSYSIEEFYGSADIYYITKKSELTNLFYILGYMNSKSFFKWFKYNGKNKGKNLEFYSTPLKEAPIYYSEKIKERAYIEKLVKIQIENFSTEVQDEIDRYFENIFERQSEVN